jgi:hypothetical protein
MLRDKGMTWVVSGVIILAIFVTGVVPAPAYDVIDERYGLAAAS